MDCNCHCSGKCKMLGGLEQKIMEALWSADKPLKPSEVQKKLGDNHAYTTIMTILQRLWAKKLVRRQKITNYFAYRPAQTKTDFINTALNDLFSRLQNSYGDLFTSYLQSHH